MSITENFVGAPADNNGNYEGEKIDMRERDDDDDDFDDDDIIASGKRALISHIPTNLHEG